MANLILEIKALCPLSRGYICICTKDTGLGSTEATLTITLRMHISVSSDSSDTRVNNAKVLKNNEE